MPDPKKISESLETLFSEKTINQANIFRDKLGLIDKSLSALNRTTEMFLSPMRQLDDSFSSGKDSVSAFNSGVEKTGIALAKVAEMAGQSSAAAAILAFSNALVSANEQVTSIGKTIDESSNGIREFRSEMFQIGSGFGKSYEESQKFGKNLASISEQISGRSVIGFSELKKAAEDASSAMGLMGLSMEDMMETVDTSAGSFNSLEAAILLSRKTGSSTRSVFESLTKSIKQQGLSMEDAMTQYSSFFDTAEKTGLKFEEVRSSLEQLAGSYKKIGLNADFARPLLETFSRSLDSAGLGISNATDLSQSLSRSLMDVAGSYEKSYLMVQKGGLDVGSAGSGGVLGASIGLRAKIMRAEESGDQSSIGLEMAQAMKKTLESMSGTGRLVDIQEAADNPALTNAYFKQESLLKSQYGMSQDDASRTIEMLKKLDDTTIMSNDALKEELGKNLNDQLKNQDKNLGYQERIAKSTESMFAASVLTNEILFKMADKSNEMSKTLAEGQAYSMKKVFSAGASAAEESEKYLEDSLNFGLNKITEMSFIFDEYTKNSKTLSKGAQVIGSATGTASEAVKTVGDLATEAFNFAEDVTAGEKSITDILQLIYNEMKNNPTAIFSSD